MILLYYCADSYLHTACAFFTVSRQGSDNENQVSQKTNEPGGNGEGEGDGLGNDDISDDTTIIYSDDNIVTYLTSVFVSPFTYISPQLLGSILCISSSVVYYVLTLALKHI